MLKIPLAVSSRQKIFVLPTLRPAFDSISERLVQEFHGGGVVHLRRADAVEPAERDEGFEVLPPVFRVQSVDPDGNLAGAELAPFQDIPDKDACSVLLADRHRVLEVEDQSVGVEKVPP